MIHNNLTARFLNILVGKVSSNSNNRRHCIWVKIEKVTITFGEDERGAVILTDENISSIPTSNLLQKKSSITICNFLG